MNKGLHPCSRYFRADPFYLWIHRSNGQVRGIESLDDHISSAVFLLGAAGGDTWTSVAGKIHFPEEPGTF